MQILSAGLRLLDRRYCDNRHQLYVRKYEMRTDTLTNFEHVDMSPLLQIHSSDDQVSVRIV